MAYNRMDTLRRLYDSIGSYNQFEAQLDAVLEEDEGTIAVMICPVCGKKYRLKANRWTLTRACPECRYIATHGHVQMTTHNKDEADKSDAELEELLNPAALWSRMCKRNPAERHAELDEITIERKEMV